jgi:flavin reductase (DIM6/NTAB) family NADH-FMN oxidoreductase RutF
LFYEPDKEDHGLPRSPFKSCVVPRPIGWITTLTPSGRVNLAPFSQLNLLGFDPGYVMFSASHHPETPMRKDSVENAERSGEFVYSMATYALRDKVTMTSRITDSTVDEMQAAGLTPVARRLVRPPRVGESPISFECKVHTTLMLPGNTTRTTHTVVVGRVIGVHIDDAVIRADGKIDIESIKPLARMGYADYTCIEKVFAIYADEADGRTQRKHVGFDGGYVGARAREIEGVRNE